MAGIPDDEETSRDWDWFAIDCDGHVGQFATGTFRLLPRSVKVDWARAEALMELFEKLPETCDAKIRPEFWMSFEALGKSAVMETPAKSERYFRYFTMMARKGLFSYDTELKYTGDYFGVAVPQRPITVDVLPEPMRRLVSGTFSTVRFRDAFQVSEDETLSW